MHIISLISHSRKNNVFFDYYEETKQGVVNYVLKADGKVIYKEPEALDDNEIQQKVQSYVLTFAKYNEPKKESSLSPVLPMSL